ncbi:Arc family DNA-binding protein [Ligilactobacillus salivarius]|uniref:Arc-like DNA binding domain-containing protein n=1 Tax=Ligilactobacillus salivarius cp400 TaxID=1273133 RepID=V6DHS1_9LACO|nr:Arc family DNA-binding protein [Ligilactobacillus salivarius]PAY46555.1 DNA-binding protein [Ligilactobacillus salivarius]UHL93924.1 Arc family DNA-binding protein [Ligilactobacillus salivarius]CDK34277.1 hypothetical protein LSCP400_00741 [Ligilactobacillus salivarius cp400]
MPDKLPRYTLRIPREKLDKIRFIADYNGRSANKEIERLIDDYISKFEESHGKIK